MTSKQRVFSHQNDKSYKDYVENKTAVTKLAMFKQNYPYLDKFNSYADYINLSKAFFRYQICSKNCSKIPTENLYNANQSFPTHYVDTNICKPTIYPNAIYYDIAQKPLYLSSNLNLQNWDPCHYRCINPSPIDDLFKKFNTDVKRIASPTKYNHLNKANIDTGNTSQCKTGLCKNAKTLFI